MRASDPWDGIDRAIAELAGRQYGVVSRAPLTAVSLSRGRSSAARTRGGAPAHPVTSPARTLADLAHVLTDET